VTNDPRLKSYRIVMFRAAATVIATLILTACASQPPTPPVDLVIIAPRMLDVRAGAYLENRAVIIRDGRITAIASSDSVQRLSAKERLTLPAGTTLMPGLIDTHVHLAWTGAPNTDAARLTVLAGFTTVRNPGATGDDDLVLRRSIEDGSVVGPRMVIARGGIGSVGGICEATFGNPGVSTPEEGRQRVDKLIGEGADFIKICTGGGVVGRAADAETTEMSQEVIDAIVAEAHRRNVRVAAHAQGSAAIRAAATAGVDSIEHGGLIDDEAARMLAAKRIPLVPTLARIRNDELRAATTARVRRARELGIPIVFGTDATVLPHGENAREFAALLDVGLTPIEAIRAATIDAAKLIGWPNRVGSIEPGFEADLIVVTNDVLTSLVPLDVKVVVARGRIVRNELAP
jgi:imidazolonepropionase-like amidohydrolase